MWASVQTVRGCPKHCSFCSVWRTDGQEPRQRGVDRVVREIVELRRLGFRFIALADDNFYPVTLRGSGAGAPPRRPVRLHQLQALREERFELMAQLAKLPDDLVFYTQITMEAAEDPEFLQAMRRAHIRGALVGVESVTAAGLKDVYKGFNLSGEALVARLQAFREHDIHVLGSFIFGLPSDDSTDVRRDGRAGEESEPDVCAVRPVDAVPRNGGLREVGRRPTPIAPGRSPAFRSRATGSFPQHQRPKLYTPHPTMSLEEIRVGTQGAWDQFYSWRRSGGDRSVVESVKARVAFVLVSKLYRQMYANTGIATDSARVARSARWAKWLGLAAGGCFSTKPMPQLQVPEPTTATQQSFV